MDISDERKAIHEAAHAAVAMHLGYEIDGAEITSTGGVVNVLRIRSHNDSLLIALAGQRAEEMLMRQPLPWSSPTDRENICESLCELGFSPKSIDYQIQLISVDVILLKLWPQISRIASELKQKKRITYNQIRNLN